MKGNWLTNPKKIDKRYKKEFKMTHKQFYKLVDILSFFFIEMQVTKMGATIHVDKKISIVLSKLCYARSTYRSGIHLEIFPSTIFVFTNEICKVLMVHLKNKYIHIQKAIIHYKKLGQALKIILEYIIYRETNHIIFVCPRNQVKIKYQLHCCGEKCE